jgi:hypothetical protein
MCLTWAKQANIDKSEIMGESIPVSKDSQHQQFVPSAWRNTFHQIVEAFKEGDFTLTRAIAGVRPIKASDAKGIADNIEDYGAQLVSLPEETWQTSVCLWMETHWDVIVDLYTLEEGCSDLVLHVRVDEVSSGYIFDVHFVYVP